MVERAPVIAAWGAGVDSTAMIIELVERGEPIDMVLFADTGSEKTDTYAFLPVFRRWMDRHDVASDVVRYEPRNFKHWPPYDSLGTNMLTNATLPSKAFGRGSCSLGLRLASVLSFLHFSTTISDRQSVRRASEVDLKNRRCDQRGYA